MEQQDEYDIIEEESEGSSRTWLWIAIVAVVAIFAFGVGAAVMLVSNRLSSPGPSQAAAPTETVRVAISVTAVVSGTPTLTVTQTPTHTLTPTPTATLSPTLTPEVVCTEAVDERLAPLYDKTLFGCARAPSQIVWAAWQPFERGGMLWRSDNDRAYVFYADGAWFRVDERWDGGPPADRGAPPSGMQAPIRGFGFVWSRNDEIFARLGWASDQERGFCAIVQDFDSGYLLLSTPVASCTAEGLFNQATAPEWREVRLAAPDARLLGASPSPPQPGANSVRPSGHGLFDAPALGGFTIDANFGEWPGPWRPISAIVYGADKHTGLSDLSAGFQVGWREDGLALAVSVTDDTFRPGPDGTTMWQGDGLELHFDRRLAEDFTSTEANDDDYQIGITPRPNYNGLRGYIWLPFANEGDLSLPHAIVAADQGYDLEVLIPWHVFDLESASIAANQTFGFNLSVSDNDSDSPAQETVASASAARTTHDNPTEWGTLRLLP